MKKLVAGIATVAFVLGTVACGGADKGAKDASDQGDDAAPKKSLEKFEGNRMEKGSDEEE